MNCEYNKHEFATEKEYYEEISRSSFYNRERMSLLPYLL